MQSDQSRPSLARRIVLASVAAAALSTPVVVAMTHAHSAPARGTHAVAMPDCNNHWAPICDRW